MGEAFLFQDWVTIALSGTMFGRGAVVQAADKWADLGRYDDVALLLDCKMTTGGLLRIQYQVAPSDDEASFQAVVPVLVPSAGGPQLSIVNRLSPGCVARWLRWKVTAASSGSMTFRIWATGYGPR